MDAKNYPGRNENYANFNGRPSKPFNGYHAAKVESIWAIISTGFQTIFYAIVEQSVGFVLSID